MRKLNGSEHKKWTGEERQSSRGGAPEQDKDDTKIEWNGLGNKAEIHNPTKEAPRQSTTRVDIKSLAAEMDQRQKSDVTHMSELSTRSFFLRWVNY